MRGILNIIICAGLWLAIIAFTLGFGLVPFGLWCFLVFSGSEARREAAMEKVRQTLMANENLIEVSVETRPFAFWQRRKAVGITESRVIVIARGLLGGFTMRDIQWKDLQDVEISENVLPDTCGIALIFSYRKRDLGSVARGQHAGVAPVLALGGVPCEEARLIYSTAQAKEQEWEEKRRVRAIEETRAAAGGVYVNTPSEKSGSSSSDVMQNISQLKKLLDGGAITDVEFNEMKSKIISRA